MNYKTISTKKRIFIELINKKEINYLEINDIIRIIRRDKKSETINVNNS